MILKISQLIQYLLVICSLEGVQQYRRGGVLKSIFCTFYFFPHVFMPKGRYETPVLFDPVIFRNYRPPPLNITCLFALLNAFLRSI